ncbi:hypothetical protein CHLRE_09g393136v5 [Chlamydomonas reinhardtii]|uniref:ENTH domain-containing protein n=1 Tax=Chlamydomonas reinhardtii TaxID=3055 RepID=A0A2K3DEC1_CHLRE|nr:uncharacterized protein CHLRE_09g393136v5 [Chlamydomonas reinhardtii]PNW78881.1 hypothetical protein CHLRE_09g393136v5 [Chlamydomonas reinhardtii]
MDPMQKQEAKYKTKSMLAIINDKMEVGMAKLRGEESAALDVAIIKATLQDEVVPKEKHVRTLKTACVGSSPRQSVNYVIHGLAKRLEENPKAWLVTLKTLIVFHRLMRETDPSFQEELLRYAERTGHHRLLRLESFADHTTKETWDYSAWIRVYSLYLDERLAVFRTMKFDPEQDQGLENRESKLKACATPELLDQLPCVQRLLSRLVSCVPEGAAQSNEVCLLACALVLKEVRSIYKVVCEGVLNLVDKFFEMDRGDALKGVELVKENLVINERLNAFVGTIGSIPPLRGAVQFPSVQPLPPDFLTTLEDYIKDAPRSAGDTAKAPLPRAATAVRQPGPGAATSAALGGTRLVVGGPIKDPPSGPTSPQPPPPAPVVDLLGFDSLSINPAPPQPAPGQGPAAVASPAAGAPGVPPYPGAQPPNPYALAAQAPSAPGAPPAAAAPFDPFASFGGAPAPTAAPAAAAPPPPAYPYGGASAFTQAPVVAAAAAGYPGAPAPQAPQQPPVPAPAPGQYGEAAFGNAFGAHPPAPAPVPQAPAPAPAAAAAAAAPFNPFANPTSHATVAPHMPPAPAAPAAGGYPPAPVSAAAPPAPAAPSPYAPAASPAPAAPGGFNPFGSPGGPAPPPAAPANPFGSPGAPSPSNPFGGAPAAAAPAPAAGNNPFAAGGWPAQPTGGAAVVTQQVAGYNLKKPADPLMDLSMDLFGKPQAPPTQQPMRPQQAAPNGSPGGALF